MAAASRSSMAEASLVEGAKKPNMHCFESVEETLVQHLWTWGPRRAPEKRLKVVGVQSHQVVTGFVVV